jgi:hypothetical protein
MFLADLDLSVLSSEVIESIIAGMQKELAERKALERIGQPKVSKQFKVQKRFGFRTYEEEITHLTSVYGSDLYALPKQARHVKLKHRLQYLPAILAQDWSAFFSPSLNNEHIYYVYAHIDPRKSPTILTPLNIVLPGEPFYIGKGCGKRAWNLTRNQGHGKKIQRLRKLGHDETALVTLLATALSEQEALILEAKLIYFFGSIYDDTVHGYLLNLADHLHPPFHKTMSQFPTSQGYHISLREKAAVMVQKKLCKPL